MCGSVRQDFQKTHDWLVWNWQSVSRDAAYKNIIWSSPSWRFRIAIWFLLYLIEMLLKSFLRVHIFQISLNQRELICCSLIFIPFKRSLTWVSKKFGNLETFYQLIFKLYEVSFLLYIWMLPFWLWSPVSFFQSFEQITCRSGILKKNRFFP